MEVKTEWDLSKLFVSLSDPRLAKERTIVSAEVQRFSEKWQKNSEYMSNENSLFEALVEFETLEENYGTSGKQGYYIGLAQSLDKTNPEIKALSGKIEEWAIGNANKLQFFSLNLGKIDPKKQQEFLTSKKLSKYHHLLARIFSTAKYDLSEKEENLLNLLDPFATSSWAKFNSEQLSKKTAKVVIEGNKVEKTLGELNDLARDINKETRDVAGKKFSKMLDENVFIAEAEMNTLLGFTSSMRKLRGATRPDEFRHISDDVESEMVDALLDAVSSKNSIASRYYPLKARLLGQKQLEYYERGVEFPVVDKKLSFDEAVSTAYEVFNKIDPEFGQIFTKFAEEGSFDVYPKKGKSSGAFCAHDGKNDPVYILLNFTGTMSDIQTLAHECGHGINDELMRKQPEIYYGTSLATAEVASTFMEDFMLHKLYDEANDEQRLNLMMNKLNDDIATTFRQVACYRFEQDLHTEYEEKKFLPGEYISKLFVRRMSEYMGDAISQKYGGKNFWVYWSHIRNHFYVYSYASGLLISKSLQRKVKEDKRYINKVKEFLSAGVSDSPANIFKKIGIDITTKDFWNDGLMEIEQLLVEAEQLASELGKI